jgi:hypothetical protein
LFQTLKTITQEKANILWNKLMQIGYIDKNGNPTGWGRYDEPNFQYNDAELDNMNLEIAKILQRAW